MARTHVFSNMIAGFYTELDKPRLLERAIRQLVELLGPDGGAIFLREPDSNRLVVASCLGLKTASLAELENGVLISEGTLLTLKGPVLVTIGADAQASGVANESPRKENAQALMLSPLIAAGDVLGGIVLVHGEPRTYDKEEIFLLTTVSNQLAWALRNAISFEKEKNREQALALRNRQLDALLKTSNSLIEGSSLERQLALLASTVKDVSGWGAISVFVADEDAETLKMVAAVGLPLEEEERLRQTTLPVANALARLFKEEYRISNSYLIHNPPMQHTAAGPGSAGSKNRWQQHDALIIPLFLNDKRLVGMLSMSHPLDGKAPVAEDIQFLEIFAGQAAIAIRNSYLYSHLQAAMRAQDEFLAIASHELKTPLTSIMAYAQHLLYKLPAVTENSVTRSHLEVINAQSRRMARLVQELLDVSALDRGTFDLQSAVIDLNEVVDKSVSSARAGSTRHRLVKEPADHPVWVLADRSRVEQVVDDLLANAVKYSPDGGNIRVLVQVEGDEAIVSISDQGVGIDKEHIPYIFDRFYQADGNPRTRQFGGMGLGLYVSKQLIEAHGGRIWVESSKGSGSTFFFALPLQLY